VNLLLDTHIFVWWRTKLGRISAACSDAIAGADNVYVSVASAWELAIKAALGKITLDVDVEEGIALSDFQPLPIAFAHLRHFRQLPHHHGDPFDRLLIAQAQVERLTIVTADPQLQHYDVPILPA
jgi:PIN domain nuclease of toxin-antitoxin system